MGDVFRQQYRKRDGSKGSSRKWYGDYKDHAGVRRRVPLATDKAAARAMLRDLERRAERRKAGLVDEDAGCSTEPLGPLVKAFLAERELAGVPRRWRVALEGMLLRTIAGCGWGSPADLAAEGLDGFLAGMGRAAKTRREYREAAVAFGAFLVRRRKLRGNPLAEAIRPVGPATFRRRALTAEELRRLVAAAEDRPLKDAETIHRGPRKGERAATVKPEVKARLVAEGRARALCYRVAFATGLRADELRALIVADLTLAGREPRLWLPGERTKNGKDARLPLPRKLAADWGRWIRETGRGPADAALAVPSQTAAVLRHDLAAAGVPFEDTRGRRADFHALRGSLASHLNAAGVPATAARAMMRHSSIRLTMETYHDEGMDDLRSAVENLPEI